jgi:membrane protease YdiL (CAAX protease family)
VGTIVPFGIGLFLAWLVGLATGTSDQSVGPLQQMWTQGTKFESIAWVLLIALVPGFVEELFYRGFLLRGLLLKWGPVASIATTGLLFAIVHGDPVSASAILPLGLWLGLVAWRTGSIWLPFSMHASVNGVWTTTMMIAHRDPGAEEWVNGAAIGALIVGMIAFVGAVVILRRPATTIPRAHLRARIVPRIAVACLASVTILAFVIPAGTSSNAPPMSTLLQSPTLAQLHERVTAQVSIASIGQDGSANFTILPEGATRLVLPPNKAGVEHVVVALDASGKVLWMAYSGELTGKGSTRLPKGVLEQLASGAPTRLCLSLESHPEQSGVTVRATVEEDDARVAGAVARAENEGWATRGRR